MPCVQCPYTSFPVKVYLFCTLNLNFDVSQQQEGALCAQHCLNALLQGPYYTAVDLATLARQLDEEERMRMAEGGDPNDPEYQRSDQMRPDHKWA